MHGNTRVLKDDVKYKMIMMMMMMVMVVTQHIPTMTKSHHDGEMSVMIRVGICQCQKSTIHHTPC